jgi:ribosomal protein S8
MNHYLLNMFTNIQNGQIAKRSFILQRRKKICEVFLKILWIEGFIIGYTVFKKNQKKIKIFLKYKNKKSAINNIKIISKPSCRIFYTLNDIYKFASNNNSLIIIFTSKGIKSLTECKKYKIGGEPFVLIN